jgi:hypothetical protein
MEKPIRKGRTISPGSYYAVKGTYSRKMARKRKIVQSTLCEGRVIRIFI